MKHTPLSERDYQRLSETLARFAGQGAMNLERLDGFVAALLCGPEALRPEECLPMILGDAFDDDDAFHTEKALEQFVRLLNGHWNDVAHAIRAGEFQPWLEADAEGKTPGNDWAESFADAMQLMNDDWQLLFDDEDAAPALEPILLLAFERHPDPDMRPLAEGLDSAQREACLSQLSDSVHAIHAFYAALRQQLADEEKELEARDHKH